MRPNTHRNTHHHNSQPHPRPDTRSHPRPPRRSPARQDLRSQPRPSPRCGSPSHPRSSPAPIAHLVEAPFEERPREGFLGHWPVGLRDAELVALVLRTGTGGQSAVGLAETLLSRYGGLAGMLRQDAVALREIKGIGAAKAASLLAVRELAARAELVKVKRGRYLENTGAVLRYLTLRLRDLQREVFGLLLLNSRHYVIGIDYLFYGSVDRSAVYTREIIKACLKRNAASVVLFHNHPSGHAEPSQSDKDITNRVSGLLDEIDVHVIDHIIIGASGPVSMAERGLVPANGALEGC